MAFSPSPPPPAPRSSSERDARTQQRLDAARAARARRRPTLTTPTPPTLRQRLLSFDERVAAYLSRNRTANNHANPKWLGAIVTILLSPTFAPILLLLQILAWVISIGVRWGISSKPPRLQEPVAHRPNPTSPQTPLNPPRSQ